MKLSVNGVEIFVATGGRAFDPALPTVVMLHGAGFDHSSWALHSRWFAHHGYGGAGAGSARPRAVGRRRLTDHRGHGRLDGGAARCSRRRKSPPGRPFHGIADRAGDRRAASGKGFGARA